MTEGDIVRALIMLAALVWATWPMVSEEFRGL